MSAASAIEYPFFRLWAQKVVDNGFSIVAVRPGEKKPWLRKWQRACFSKTEISWLCQHARRYPNDSIGIACGRNVIAIDIDETDAALAQRIESIAIEELGDTTLVRFGQFPKRALVYGTLDEIHTQHFGKIDILGSGSQFIAFGVHPKTGAHYYWSDDNPADTDADSLRIVSAADVRRFVERISNKLESAARAKCIAAANDNRRPTDSDKRLSRRRDAKLANAIVRDAGGKVIDGREAFLTLLIWQSYSDGYRSVRRQTI